MASIGKLYISSLMAAMVCVAQDRPGRIMSFTVTSDDIHVSGEMMIEPPQAAAAHKFEQSGVTANRDRKHRYTVDGSRQAYFGYDLEVQPIFGTRQFRVAFLPLTIRPETFEPDNKAVHRYRNVLLASYPAPQVVNEGDTIAVDLLVSADGRSKVVDYLKISRPLEAALSPSIAESRDFTLDDVELRLSSPKLLVDGALNPDQQARFGEVTGAIGWVYIPKRGRFLLSIKQHSGFVKAGTLRDSATAFSIDGSFFQIQMAKPVLPVSGTWNLYVLHDPSYTPKQGSSEIVFGAADKVDYLLK